MENQIERLKIQKDILWGLYQEHRTHARHSETLRATATNMLIVASAVLVSIVISDKAVTRVDLGAAALLIGFGLLGVGFNIYYSSKTFEHKRRAKEYFKEFTGGGFFEGSKKTPDSILTEADEAYKTALRKKVRNRAFLMRSVEEISNSFVLWGLLPFLISLVGVLLGVISILEWTGRINVASR